MAESTLADFQSRLAKVVSSMQEQETKTNQTMGTISKVGKKLKEDMDQTSLVGSVRSLTTTLEERLLYVQDTISKLSFKELNTEMATLNSHMSDVAKMARQMSDGIEAGTNLDFSKQVQALKQLSQAFQRSNKDIAEMREKGQKVTNGFALDDLAERFKELAAQAASVNEQVNGQLVNNIKKIMEAFSTFGNADLSNFNDAIAAYDELMNHMATAQQELSKKDYDFLGSASNMAKGQKEMVNTLQGVDSKKIDDALKEIPASLSRTVIDIESQEKLLTESFDNMNKVISGEIEEDKFTSSLNGVRQAINDLNTALTGAQFDEEMNHMSGRFTGSLRTLHNDIQKELKEFNKLPETISKSISGINVPENRASLLNGAAEAFTNVAAGIDKLRSSANGLDSEETQRKIADLIVQINRAKQALNDLNDGLTDSTTVPDVPKNDNGEIDPDKLRTLRTASNRVQSAVDKFNTALESLTNSKHLTNITQEFTDLKEEIEGAVKEVKNLKTELDSSIGKDSSGDIYRKVEAVLKAYTNVEKGFSQISNSTTVNIESTGSFDKFEPMRVHLSQIRQELAEPLRIHVDIDESNEPLEKLKAISEYVKSIRESVEHIDPSKVERIVRSSNGSKEVQGVYKELEATITKIASLQGKMNSAREGTAYWDELNRQLEAARNKYNELQEQVEKYNAAERNTQRESKIKDKYGALDDAKALADARKATTAEYDKVKKVYDDTEKELNKIISLRQELDKMSDQKDSPYWNELSYQLEEAQENFQDLKASWKDFDDAYRNADKEASIIGKYNSIEEQKTELEAKKETAAIIKYGNDLYKEEETLLKKVYDQQLKIAATQTKGGDTSALNTELEEAQERLTELDRLILALPDFAKNAKMDQANEELRETLEQQESLKERIIRVNKLYEDREKLIKRLGELAKEAFNTTDEEREKAILEEIKNIQGKLFTLRMQTARLGKDAGDPEKENRLKTMQEEIIGQTYLNEALKKQTDLIKERTKFVNNVNKNPMDIDSQTRLDALEKELAKLNDTIKTYERQATAKQKVEIENNKNTYAENQVDAEKQRVVLVEKLVGLYKQLGDVYDRMAKIQDSDPKKDLMQTKATDIQNQIKAIIEMNKELINDPQVQAAFGNAVERGVFATEAATAKELEAQMKRLTQAVNEYKKAQRGGDSGGVNHWKQEIESAKNMTKQYLNHAKETGATQEIQDKIAETIKKQETLTSDLTDGINTNNTELTNMLNHYLSIALVMRELRQLWKEAIDYVVKYYDQMNEIRVVTGKTQEQADQLGESLRNKATEYDVSSLEVAESAVTFYRQGLSDAQVEDRLNTVTKFAKTANLSLAETAEIITAVVNSYRNYVDAAGNVGISSEKVSDIFTTLGNSAGTSATELGKAAQVVAAYGSSVGLSLEKLSAYIATLSESTRLAPETIGRSLQSIMSRMQNLKMKGYTDSEDGDNASLNDVAKALDTINVSLMDSAGNWRNIDDVFDDIAAKWNTMTDKQQAFISTTIAGTRQKNYFTALMQDMAGAQRSAELYELALNSAGSTSKAFETWTESVAAAQGRLRAALEKTYAMMMKGDWIKFFYNSLTGLVDGFNSATKAASGLNVILGVLIPAVYRLITAIAGVGGVKASLAAVWTFIGSKPLLATVGAILALTTALTVLTNTFGQFGKDASKSMDEVSKAIEGVKTNLSEMQDNYSKISGENTSLERLRDEYVELATKTEKTADDQARLNELYTKINELVPGFSTVIANLSDKYSYQSDVVEAQNKKIEENIELLHAQARAAAEATLPEIGKAAQDMVGIKKQLDDNKYSEADVLAFAEAQFKSGGYTKHDGMYFRNGANGEVEAPIQKIIEDMVRAEMIKQYNENIDTSNIVTATEEALKKYMGEGQYRAFAKNATEDKINSRLEMLGNTVMYSYTGSKNRAWDEYTSSAENEARYQELAAELQAAVNTMIDTATKDIIQLPRYMNNERLEQINKMRSELDMTADAELETRVRELVEAIDGLNRDYTERYNKMTTEERLISDQLEKAYSSGDAETYNQLVDQYNQMMDQLGKGVKAHLDYMEKEVTTVASSPETSKTTEKTVEEMRKEFGAVTEAFSNSFNKELIAIKNASFNEDGTFNPDEYAKALSDLQKNNETLYNHLVSNVGDLNKILTGEISDPANFFSLDGIFSYGSYVQLYDAFKVWNSQVADFEKEITARNGNSNAIMTFLASQFEIHDASEVKELIARTSDDVWAIIQNAMQEVGLTDIDSVFESETPKTDILKYVEGTVEKLQYEMERLADKRMTPSKLAEGFEELKRAMHMEDGSGLDKMVKAYAAMNETTKGKFLSNTGLTEEWFELLGKGAELTAEEIRNLNEELLKAEYAKVGNNWNTLATAVANLGKEANNTGSDISSVLDDLKDYGQARAGIEWLLANSDTADSETVAAVRKKISSIIKVSEDYLKDNDQLNFFAQMFEEGEMSQVRKSIQNFYDLFRDMLNEGDYSIDLSAIDFTDSEAVINALDTIIQEAIDSEDRALADAAKALRQFVLEGFVGLQEETATIMDQTLDMTALNEGSFDKINKSKTEYGKMLGLKELLTYASRSKEALAELADEWQRTEESTKKTYRNWIDSEIWDILDKRNITDADQSKFGALIGNIKPEKLIEVNSELETLRSNLNNIEAYGEGSAKGLGALRDEIDQTKQGIAAFRAYTSENSSLKLKGAAKDALIQWLGIPETLFDSDAGMDAIEAEVVRRQESQAYIYDDMAKDIIYRINNNRSKINESLIGDPEAFWEDFDALGDDYAAKIDQLTGKAYNLREVVPEIYSFQQAIKFLSETGDLDGLVVNLEDISELDFNLAKNGLGTFDVFNNMENGVKAAIDMVKMFQNATTDKTLLEEYRKEWKETAQTVQTSMLDKLKLKPELRKELEELLNATTLSTEEMERFAYIWNNEIDLKNIGDINEIYRTLFTELPNQWSAMSSVVSNLGNGDIAFGGILDEIKKYGQAQAGFAWLLGDGTADRETVDAVRNMISTVTGIAVDQLKTEDGLNLANYLFQSINMEKMKQSIQNFYSMFNQMVADYGVEIDFSNAKTTISGLNTIMEKAVANEDNMIRDAAALLISFVSNGFVELGKESATVMDQTLDMVALKMGQFDLVNKSTTDYGKLLSLDTLLSEAATSKEALSELAAEWDKTDDSVKQTFRDMKDTVPPEVWKILDKGPANIDDSAFIAFGEAVNKIDPSKLVTTNTELERLKKILEDMRKGGSTTAQGLSNIQKDIDDTKQAIAAYHFLYDDPLGQYGTAGGNIDLHNRQVAYNRDGSISTVESFSFWDDDVGKEVLVPSVINGKHVSQNEAIDEYYKTGQHLGMFDTWQEADAYAEMLHEEQERMYAMVEERKAAQKALMDWLGVSETMFDTEEGRKKVKEEAERRVAEETKVYQEMYTEIMNNVATNKEELEKRLGEGFDWDAFAEASQVDKIKMLAENEANLSDLIPDLYSFAEAINYLSETGDLSDLILNFDQITSEDFNLAKLGFGTFDIIDKMKSDVKAAKSQVNEFQYAAEQYYDGITNGADEPEKALKDLRDEWRDTSEATRKSLLDKMKIPQEVRDELEDLMELDELTPEQWERFAELWSNMNLDTIGRTNEYLEAIRDTIDSSNDSIETYIKNMNDLLGKADAFSEAYDAFLLLLNGEGSDSDTEAAKSLLAKYLGIDEAVLETESGMELVKQIMNEKFAETLEGNKELWEEFNSWLTEINEERDWNNEDIFEMQDGETVLDFLNRIRTTLGEELDPEIERTITLLETLIKNGNMGVDAAGNATVGDRSGSTFSEGRMFDQMRGSNVQDQIEGYNKLQAALSGTQTQINGVIDKYNQMSVDARRSFDEQIKGCDDLIGVLHGTSTSYSEAAREASLMSQALQVGQLETAGRVLKGTSDTVKNLGTDLAGFTTASTGMLTNLTNLNVGWDAYAYIMAHAGQKSESMAAAMKDLSAVTNIPINQLGNQMPLALNILMGNTDAAVGSIQFLLNYLQALAGVRIDPSNWQKSLNELSKSSDTTVAHLATLIENLMEVAGKQIGLKLSQDGKTGQIQVTKAQLPQKKKKFYTSPLGNGGYGSGKSSGSGSTSPSSSSSSSSTKSTDDPAKKWREYLNKRQTAFLEEMEVRVDAIQDMLDRLGIIEKQWKGEGYLTGVINTLTAENNAIERQTDVLKQNMQSIEAEINKVKQELSQTSIGTEDYDNATKRLAALQKKYAEYTKAVMNNTNSIKQNMQAIKDYRLQIWKQESDLRNLINKAIEERNQREQEAFQATQKIEEKIISLIKRRYEKERDEIIQNTRIKIKSLQTESSALSDELSKRKQRSENEDNLKKLRELQTQYARISADPTRVKEAKNIAQQINDLQAEMAWDAAEQEVEAKQESIQQQIDEMEDYADYTEDYYENLLKDPRNFAAEVTRIMSESMTEILEWLKRNDEEYLLATDNMRKDYIDSWTNTLNTSRGIIQTNWEEVERIIQQGDEAIINFLKDNLNEYLQADSYGRMVLESGWQDTINNLHRAYENLFPDQQMFEFTNTAQTYFSELQSTLNDVETAANNTAESLRNIGSGIDWDALNDLQNIQFPTWENQAPITSGIVQNNNPNPNEYMKGQTQGGYTDPGVTFTTGPQNNGNNNGGAKGQKPASGKTWTASYYPTAQANGVYATIDQSGNSDKFYIIDEINGVILGGPWQLATTIKKWERGVLTGDYADHDVISNNPSMWTFNRPGYATGGLNTQPGLAELHGTANAPERILSPKQTALFEDMVKSLEEMSRINVNLPTLANLPDMTGGGSEYNFGDIVVNVSSLSSDADYEEVADQLMETIRDRMNRGMPIGGVRIQR